MIRETSICHKGDLEKDHEEDHDEADGTKGKHHVLSDVVSIQSGVALLLFRWEVHWQLKDLRRVQE